MFENTNDTLPKCTSLNQFNRELDEKAQYLKNNPNAIQPSRKRKYRQNFEDIPPPDVYTESPENAYNLSNFIKNPHPIRKRDKKIIEDSDESDIEIIAQADDISRFIPKRTGPEVPDATPKPTKMFIKKDEIVESPLKQDPDIKVCKDNPYAKMLGDEIKNDYKSLNQTQSRTNLPMPSFNGYQSKSISNPNLNDIRSNNKNSKNSNYGPKQYKRAKYCEQNDDDFYAKGKQIQDDTQRTGDMEIDYANSGRGFANGLKQFKFDCFKQGKNPNQVLNDNERPNYSGYYSKGRPSNEN